MKPERAKFGCPSVARQSLPSRRYGGQSFYSTSTSRKDTEDENKVLTSALLCSKTSLTFLVSTSLRCMSSIKSAIEMLLLHFGPPASQVCSAKERVRGCFLWFGFKLLPVGRIVGGQEHTKSRHPVMLQLHPQSPLY